MNKTRLLEIYKASIEESSLGNHPFDGLDVTIDRCIQYANNVLLVASRAETESELLLVYAVFEEAKRALYWTDEMAYNCISHLQLYNFEIADFRSLYGTHFRSNPNFEKIELSNIIRVSALHKPAYDDWVGEFLIETTNKKYILFWDYCQ